MLIVQVFRVFRSVFIILLFIVNGEKYSYKHIQVLVWDLKVLLTKNGVKVRLDKGYKSISTTTAIIKHAFCHAN